MISDTNTLSADSFLVGKVVRWGLHGSDLMHFRFCLLVCPAHHADAQSECNLGDLAAKSTHLKLFVISAVQQGTLFC